MGNKLNILFVLIKVLLLIFSIRVIKAQNIELNCRMYASDVKCQVSNHISVNMTVEIKKVISKTLQQKQLEEAPVIVLSRANQIESLPQQIGYHFKKLKELIANLIGLKVVRHSDFSDMTSLSTLNLADNKLTEIPSNAFNDLKNLTILFINGNQIKTIDPLLLKNLKLLRAFNAQHNKIEILPEIFTENIDLESISLNNNQLSKISVNFKKLNKLKHVDLRNNREICTRCTMRNQKALNRTYDICITDDNVEKKKMENQFKTCVLEIFKTNTELENKLSNCKKEPSFGNCIMSRIDEISDGKNILKTCINSKQISEDMIDKNLKTCLYCKHNISDIINHAKLCDLRYSEFSLYNITSFDIQVHTFFNSR